MTDLPSSLGIEAVECLADAGRSVTVRITGRWRRRRPEPRGQATLMVETDTGRQRFPAMPEPPSLTGAAPGTWRMSFSVPAALAPVLPGRTFLQLGGVMVPLPIGEVEVAPPGLGPEVLEERRARGSELAADTARRRSAELAADVERLERGLGDAREQSERLRDSIAERDRRLRAADQHIHAERALRSELEQQLARQERTARHDLSLLHERVADLERGLIRMRRAVDEAQHLAAAADAARAEAERRAERRANNRDAPVASAPAAVAHLQRGAGSRRELVLHHAARATPPAGIRARPAQRPADEAALRLETGMVRQADVRVAGLASAARVATLERELAAAREEVEVQRRRSARAYEAIELVRAELRQIRTAQPAPPAAVTPSQPVAPEPTAPARAPTTTAGAPAEPVQAERLSEALARLRERTPAPEAESEPVPAPAQPPEPAPAQPPVPSRAAKPWIEPAFRALSRSDPTAAGRLLLALLPAQRAADPRAVAYDLVLGDLVCAQVTVGSAAIHVERADTPRPAAEVDFRLVGDLAGVARFLVAGRLRRRLPSRRRARVRGNRRRVDALDHLIRARLSVDELVAAGVTLEATLAFTLAAAVIDPGWTAGERFTIAHREPAAAAPAAYLHVRDAKAPLASTAPPHAPVTTVVVCAAEDLIAVLAGHEVRVEGDERPLALIRQWLDRAQCG